MKNNYLLPFAFFSIILFSSLALPAQKVPMKFGKIEPVYFEMKSYNRDTSAKALILGDYGESRIIFDPNDGFVVEYTRHFRAKVFKKEGYDLANQSFVLFHTARGKERIDMLKGTVYNMENGKIVESDLDKKMIFEEVIDSRRTEHKFTLPNVREGSILEYTYQLRSDFWSINDWQFQYEYPALWSEYRVSYPEYFVFKKLQKGYLSLDVSESTLKPVNITLIENSRDYMDYASVNKTSTNQYHYNDNFYRWVKNDVPAFHEEPYMNAAINYQAAMEFEISSYRPAFGAPHNYTQTWEEINSQLLQDEDFGLQLNRGGFLKDNVDMLKAGSRDSLKLMIAAFNFIRNTMKWDGRSRVYVTQALRNSFEKKSGSSADINLILVTLLRELGLNSNPVLISTRSNGIIHPAQIMVNQFNYVIASVKIGSGTYLLDATDKGCPYSLLPDRCLNGQGRVISENHPGWIELSNSQRHEFTNMITASIGADGLITGKMQHLYGKYAAMEKRKEIKDKKDNEEYIRNLESADRGLTVKEFELLGIDSLNQPFQENLQVEINDLAQVTGNIMSFSPLPFDPWTDNPFKPEERKFPVDFTYPHIYRDILIYTIPDGFVLDEKPEDILISLPDGKTKFSYRINVTGNQLQISGILDIGKSLYINDEYLPLKEFFSKVVSKRAEKIVLKKS